MPYIIVRSENNPIDNNRSKIMLMPIFDKKKLNGRRRSTIKKIGGRWSINGKSKIINSMGQCSRNDSQQTYKRNKR